MQKLEKELDKNGGLVGPKALARLTGKPLEEILSWAEENDLPQVDGVFVFASEDVDLMLEDDEESDGDEADDDE